MEYVLSFLWIAVELLSLFFFCRAFMPPRRNRKQTVLIFALGAVLIFCINALPVPFVSRIKLLRKVLTLVVCYVLAWLCFSWKWYGTLLIGTLYYLLITAADTLMVYGTSMALGMSVSALMWKKWLYIMVVTVGKCFFLLLCFLLDQHRNRLSLSSSPGSSVWRMAVFPLVSIFMLYATFEGYKTRDDLSAGTVVFTLVLVAANAAMIIMLRNMERSARAEREVALLHQSMALQRENIRSLEQSYRSQRSATHEYNHQLQTLSDLLQQGNVEEAKAYLSRLQQGQTGRIFAVNTHHPVVDVVLNEKYRLAKEKGIDIFLRVNDLSSLNLPSDALVVLLTNLLDNALEACEKVTGEKTLECSLILEDSLFLSVRNSSLPVTVKDGSIPTTKVPPAEHGFGLPAIHRILEDLGGESAMEYENGIFSFAAEIPNPPANSEKPLEAFPIQSA